MSKKQNSFGNIIIKYNAFLILLVLIIASAFLSPVFLTSRNIFNILRQNVPIFLMSMGMLMVVLTGGIDLSVGSIAAMGCMMCSVTMIKWGWNSAIGLIGVVLLTLLVGMLIGAMDGFLIAYLDMAPFVASLAIMTIARGLAYMITNGQPVSWGSKGTAVKILLEIGSGTLFMIPWPVIIGTVVFIIFLLVSKYTVFGRLIIATGSNREAVRLSGIKEKKYIFSAYVISGLMCSLSGILMSCRSGTGTPVSGEGYELDAIAACVIGGASLSGGAGKVENTLVGVLVLALITNVMNLMSVPAYPQKIIKGLIIIAAVLLQNVGHKKS